MPTKKLCKKRFDEQQDDETQHLHINTTAINSSCTSSRPPILVHDNNTATRLSPSPLLSDPTRLQTIVSPVVPNTTPIHYNEDEHHQHNINIENTVAVTLPELEKKHEADLNSCVAAHNLLQLTRSLSPRQVLPSRTHSHNHQERSSSNTAMMIANESEDVTTTRKTDAEHHKTKAKKQQRLKFAKQESSLAQHDVLCGRGAGTSNRAGNIHYRNLIQRYSAAYRAASSTVDKNRIATGIVEQVQLRGCFMKKIFCSEEEEEGTTAKKSSTLFYYKEIEDKVAVEKTCQALRDASSVSTSSPLLQQYVPISVIPKATTTTTITNTSNPADDNDDSSATPSSSTIQKSNIKHAEMDTINVNDVLLGRGGFTNNHTGNRRFRQLVQQYQMQYFHASKLEKPAIASMVVQIIRRANPPGRFLKKVKAEDDADSSSSSSVGSFFKSWKDVGDLRAREKVSQALREKAPELKAMYTTAQRLTDLNVHVSSSPKNNNVNPAAEERVRSTTCNSSELIIPRATILRMCGTAGVTESVRSVSPHPTTTPNSPNPSNQSLLSLSSDRVYVNVVGEHDVLCGRGAGVNNHPGNQRFRELVKFNRGDYKRTNSKRVKSEIARSIVATIYGHGGRFLKKVSPNANANADEDECVWIDVGTHKANEKTSQALREGHSSAGSKRKQANVSGNGVTATDGQSLRIRVPLSYVC